MHRKSILVALAALVSPVALGHPGGIDADGCHTNRKTGEYHCHHSGTAKPNTSKSTETPNIQSTHVSPQSSRSLPPGCYVGPRGGTYTITKSGKKNYGGC
ncbi:YHYH domain-containing protein [Azovibrio restrictus]|uniref:YHYH domain-containing protein n=1 Tax=Azovibrio restrictus TaxID=146938 RepID=UPI000A073032